MSKEEITIDDLAVMVNKGFDDINKRFNNVEDQIKSLKQGQENIGLKLDNVAYQFQVQALHKRLLILEKKAGINSPAVA
ncbi:MAG: hypothetical protein ABIE43_01095 [Patescibacteria group bacterium]